MLGVVVNNRMTATDHVAELLRSCTKLLYALWVLRSHGLPQQSLKDVFRATVESKIQYAAPAWSGLYTVGDRVQLNAFLRRCMKLGDRERDSPSVEIFAMSDDQLFSKINSNSLHILQQFMPDRPSSNYSLRARPHNKTLITKTPNLMTRTSSLEVSIKTHIDCILNISTIILAVLCMYITAPPVNYSILCIPTIVHMVAFVNLLLKKMVVVVGSSSY